MYNMREEARAKCETLETLLDQLKRETEQAEKNNAHLEIVRRLTREEELEETRLRS